MEVKYKIRVFNNNNEFVDEFTTISIADILNIDLTDVSKFRDNYASHLMDNLTERGEVKTVAEDIHKAFFYVKQITDFIELNKEYKNFKIEKITGN